MSIKRRVQLRALSSEQSETVSGGIYQKDFGSNITTSSGNVYNDWCNAQGGDSYQDGAF